MLRIQRSKKENIEMKNSSSGAKKRKRNIRLELYVYPEEKEIIEAKMKAAGYTNMSGYIRKSAVYDKIVVYDFDIIKQTNKELNKIGVNINQLITRINSTENLYQEDLNYLKEKVEQIWQLQQSILSNLP